MDDKIFLRHYRVSAAEIELEGELQDAPLAYEAKEIESGRQVIVEIIPAASLKPAVRDRLEAEAEAAKKLNHINIPALYDFGTEDDRLVYVTEDFDGTLAEEWVNTHGPMPVAAVLRIASQVVSALGAAAIQRINHHAINPTNLVLVPGQTPEGEWPLVKILHFVGVAPKFYDADEGVAAFDKSSHYASPEQMKRGGVDFRSEVYSLGCTMWFLLTGTPPLPVTDSTLAVPAAKLVEKLSNVPKTVRRLLAQMLSVNPNDRPKNPLAFYREIQDCLGQVEQRETMARRFGVASISTTAEFEKPKRRRRPMRALALAALLLASSALAAAVLHGYLKHLRVVRAEEPIGVEIGVPDAAASAPPLTAVAPTSTQSDPAIAEANEKAPASKPEETIAPLPTANDPAEVASTDQIAPAPLKSPAPANAEPEPSAPVATNNPTPAAAESDSASFAAAQESATPAPMQTEPAAVEEKAPVEQSASEKAVTHEVRRAEPAEPEVRRAEPAPPEEAPVVSKPRVKKTERDVKPKRRASRDVYVTATAPDFENELPPLPPGSVHARFIGVMPDGRWMLALPSRKVILVPPPPSRR